MPEREGVADSGLCGTMANVLLHRGMYSGGCLEENRRSSVLSKREHGAKKGEK